MEAIKVATSICPHFTKGQGRGHYIIGKRIFTKGTPVLNKLQFVGFNGFLFVTVDHPGEYDTVFKMSQYVTHLNGREVTWLGSASLSPYQKGFKIYLPEHILKAEKPGRIESTGVFRKHKAPGFEIYYLEVPKLSAEVLLGRQSIHGHQQNK